MNSKILPASLFPEKNAGKSLWLPSLHFYTEIAYFMIVAFMLISSHYTSSEVDIILFTSWAFQSETYFNRSLNGVVFTWNKKKKITKEEEVQSLWVSSFSFLSVCVDCALSHPHFSLTWSHFTLQQQQEIPPDLRLDTHCLHNTLMGCPLRKTLGRKSSFVFLLKCSYHTRDWKQTLWRNRWLRNLKNVQQQTQKCLTFFLYFLLPWMPCMSTTILYMHGYRHQIHYSATRKLN